MNAVWSTSDLYSQIAAASIASVLENCKDIDDINIYIIDMGISETHKKWIDELVKSYNKSLYWLDKLNIEQFVGVHIDVGRWHISTYSRLFLTRIMPKNVDKVIYIDCDMIIRKSLKDLWEMDMEDYYVMAADDCRGTMYRDNIGVARDSIYTNNGLMVINLKSWRDNKIDQAFVEFIRKYKGDITYMDQGVLNGVLQPLHKVKLLPISYNAQTVCYDLGYDGIEACRKPVWAYSREEFEKSISDPYIVHFTTCFMSGTRPWFKNDKHRYRDEFLVYRSLTKWKDEPLMNDDTKILKKLMTLICNIFPKGLIFFVIRIFHVWVYPAIRNLKNGVFNI